MKHNVIYAVFILMVAVFLWGCAQSQVKQKTSIFKNHETEKKVANFRRKLMVNSNDVETRMELGMLFLSEERIKEAISEFEKVLSIEPQHIKAYLSLSLALQKQSDPDLTKVIDLLKKAMEIAPYNADVHLNLAHVYAKLNQEDKAIYEFNKAIDLYDNTATLVSARLGLMAIYKKRGNLEKADQEHEKVYKIYPGVDEMIKQTEINILTPAPQYVGEEFSEGEGGYPSLEERITRAQEQINKMSVGRKRVIP